MSTSIEKATASKYTLEQWLQSDKFKRTIENIVGDPQTAVRFVQICESATRRNPALLDCDQGSVLSCLIKLSQANLEPDGYHAHLIPFNNRKTGRLEAQLIVDYKGMIRAIRRDLNVAVMKGGVIYQKDMWGHEEGNKRWFTHKPTYQAPDKDNPIIMAYSFIQWKDGDWDVDILPVWKVELTRARSRAADSGPWVTDYDEMCIKTAIRHHSKRLPLRSEDRAIINLDDDQYEHQDPFSGKLVITKPEFKNERSLPSVDTSGSGGDLGKQGGSAQAEAPARTQEPRKRSNKGREEKISAPADTGIDYGPSSHSAPDAARASNGGDQGVLQQSHPSKTATLLEKINKSNFTQTEVISFLGASNRDLGQAGESGLVADLPAETIDMAIQHWASILYNLKRDK